MSGQSATQTLTEAKPAITLQRAGMLQRQCACGNHTVAGGECTECAKKKGGLQRKLAIGASNDPLEREADRVADQVLAASAHSTVSGAQPRIQRYAGQATAGAVTAPVSVDRVLAGSGRPLDSALRQDMEQRFGYDFSRVRVHSGGAAEQSAREVNAHAYTVGHNIVFGAGRFEPETLQGRRLIAHELTHVVQQSGSDGIHVGQDNDEGGRFVSSQAVQATASGRQPVTVHGTPGVYLARAPRSLETSLNPELLSFTELEHEINEIQAHLDANPVSNEENDRLMEAQTALRKELAKRHKQEGKGSTKQSPRAAVSRAPRSLSQSLRIDETMTDSELNDEIDAIHAALRAGVRAADRANLKVVLTQLDAEKQRRNGVAVAQARTQKIQRAFTPKLSSNDADALVEVMGIIESIRPSESASGLYTLVRDGEVLTITKDEYDKIRASAQKSLLDNLWKVRSKADDAQTQYRAQHEINEDQWIVSGAVHLFGGIDDPGESIRQNVRYATVNANAAQVFIDRGQLVRGAEFFAKSEMFATIAKKTSQAYVNDLISTGETVVTVLEVTRDVAAVVVVAIAVVVAAPIVIGAAANAIQAAPLILALGTAAVPAAEVAAVAIPAVEVAAVAIPAAEVAVVAAPAAVAVAAPAAVAVAAPAAVAVAAPVAVAVAAPAAVAVAAPAAVAVPVAASSALSTAALATAGVVAASTTLSSDSPKPVDPEDDKKKKKKRPPFVLRLPQQKAPHLGTYRSWLGVLQSDPNYARGNPDQLEAWHRELRIGGGNGIPKSVYERGHTLGFTGETGERQIRVPDWSRTKGQKTIRMQVDHIVELQLTPDTHREEFDSMFNWELLDSSSNVASRNILVANIAIERAKQIAFDPSLPPNSVLRFDEVTLGGGTAGERWSSDEIRAGEQLDAFEKHGEK